MNLLVSMFGSKFFLRIQFRSCSFIDNEFFLLQPVSSLIHTLFSILKVSTSTFILLSTNINGEFEEFFRSNPLLCAFEPILNKIIAMIVTVNFD